MNARRQPALALLLAAGLLAGGEGRAGPYSAARNDAANPHDPPLPAFVGPDGDGFRTESNRLNPLFVAWVSRVVDYAPGPGVDAAWTDTALVEGPATADQFDIASLGELDAAALDAGTPPGRITVAFPFDLVDGPGPDFAVFENGFAGFMELAFVEVSTDGATFARFPAASLTASPVPPYTPFDPTNVFNLAGKHHHNNDEGWGTPFDLAQLAALPAVTNGAVDLARVRFVRLVDIPGRGDFRDASGRPVYDPWPTFGSGGFDLEAIGIIQARVDLTGAPGPGAGQGTERLSWVSVPNRINRLLACARLGDPWLEQHRAAGDGLPWEVIAPSDGPRRYYRVELQPLPVAP